MNRFHQITQLALAVGLIVVTSTTAADEPDVQQFLKKKISIESESGSLNSLLLAMNDQVKKNGGKFEIKVSVKDLQLEGITRNQRVSPLELKDKSLAEILTTIVVRANPDLDVKAPADPNLKLVWVVASDLKNPDRQFILITTRRGAKKRGLKLPGVFQVKAN